MQPRWRCSQVDRRDSLRSRCHDPSGGGGEGRAGKTLLLRQLFPKASYFLLEDPEVVARPGGARLWFSSYLQTYLERNVRAVTAVKDLALFRRFLALLASRRGQVLNKTDLAAATEVPELIELGRLDTSLPFDELKRRSHINEAARAANDAQDFSQRIRVNVPAPVAPGRGRRPGE